MKLSHGCKEKGFGRPIAINRSKFETHGRIFEGYGRLFEGYGRPFEGYGRPFEGWESLEMLKSWFLDDFLLLFFKHKQNACTSVRIVNLLMAINFLSIVIIIFINRLLLNYIFV